MRPQEPILILAAGSEISAGTLDMYTHSQVTLVVRVLQHYPFAFNLTSYSPFVQSGCGIADFALTSEFDGPETKTSIL